MHTVVLIKLGHIQSKFESVDHLDQSDSVSMLNCYYSMISYFVLVPPNIRAPLENTTTVITEGDTTTITCEAVGYPPPTIEWDRTNGALSARVSVSDSVSAPTGNGNVTSVSENLTLTNGNREDTGLYECSASNSVGSDNRNTSVTVQCELIVIC